MNWGGGSIVVNGTGEDAKWKSVGRGTVFNEGETDYLVFHALETGDSGGPRLMVREIEWDSYGWPAVNLPVGN